MIEVQQNPVNQPSTYVRCIQLQTWQAGEFEFLASEIKADYWSSNRGKFDWSRSLSNWLVHIIPSLIQHTATGGGKEPAKKGPSNKNVRF